MAQTTDYEIANSSGLVFRGRVNEVLAAVQSSNSGATAPTATSAGMLWFDTSVTPAILRRRNAADSAWINVYSTEDLASQAEAEAGTDNTKLMTALRTKQAIDTQVAAVASMTLLGTLTTTSGSTQTLSGLDLTNYKDILFYVQAVSLSGTSFLRLDGQQVSSALTNALNVFRGYGRLTLTDGTGFSVMGLMASGTFSTATESIYGFKVSYTTASTSISFTTGAGTFDAGSIQVYGVK